MQISDLTNRLNKCVDHFKTELSKVKTGRATPSLVESIPVDTYGSIMQVRELASITLLDSQNILISPWDKGVAKDIYKAIAESDLKVSPVIDGSNIRVPIPALTEERRIEMTKIVSTKLEESKNSIRSVRQDAMKDIEKEFADKKIGEDEKFTQKDKVEKTVKDFIQQADELSEAKKLELLKIN